MDGGISKTLFKERKAFFELSARDSSGEGISKTVFKERKDFFELSATGGASNQSTQKPRESKPPTGYMSQPIQGNIIVKNSNVSITEPASAGSSSNQSTQKTPESQSPTRPMPQPIEACDDMKTVGAYEYHENDELGRGAFGLVYKGRNKTKLQELVAIKEVRLNKSSYDLTMSRENEILKALSTKRHENIVALLHFEAQKRHMYFVMELCNGGCLREYLRRAYFEIPSFLQGNQQLDERTIVTFLKQIAAGLKVVHDNDIIHRDLKPENILLCFSGLDYPSSDRITLKIGDFGVGRFLRSDEVATTNIGTLHYMAPEVLTRRSSGYDYKVDLWSVGVIAYECLFGSLPRIPIAVNGFQIPMHATKEFANLLRGLLENDENKRYTLKHVLDYQILDFSEAYSVISARMDIYHSRDCVGDFSGSSVKNFRMFLDGDFWPTIFAIHLRHSFWPLGGSII